MHLTIRFNGTPLSEINKHTVDFIERIKTKKRSIFCTQQNSAINLRESHKPDKFNPIFS